MPNALAGYPTLVRGKDLDEVASVVQDSMGKRSERATIGDVSSLVISVMTLAAAIDDLAAEVEAIGADRSETSIASIRKAASSASAGALVLLIDISTRLRAEVEHGKS